MGLLLDNAHWAQVVTELARYRSKLGQRPSREVAAQIRSLACKELNSLVTDPDFTADLQSSITLAKNAPTWRSQSADFLDFLSEFMRMETRILTQCGAPSPIVVDLMLEQANLPMTNLLSPAQVDRLEEKIRFCASLACQETDDAAMEALPPWTRAWHATVGVFVISADAGAAGAAAATMGPAAAAMAAAVVGASVGAGADRVNEAIRGRW